MTDISTTVSPRAASGTHTPGPWRISDNPYGAIVSDHPTGRPGENGATTEQGRYPGECETYGGYVICESVLPKNMSLIAAAPEMFETLRFAEAWIAGPLGGLGPGRVVPPEAYVPGEALARIRSLLSRIEQAEAEVQG